MKRYIILLYILMFVFFQSCRDKQQHADLVIHNAKVYTVNDDFSIAESFAIKDGFFIEVGTDEEILNKYSANEFIDLDGMAVYPGFIDAHCHFYYYGLGLQRDVDLVGTKSFKDVIELLKEHHKKYPSEWIVGRGWDQNDWDVKEFPDKKALDENFPDNPVYITRIDGHAALVNSLAIKKAGIDNSTVVKGGEFKVLNNEFTGILIDNALELVRDIIPKSTRNEKIKGLVDAQENCFSVGLTSIADAGLETYVIRLIDSLQNEATLNIRIYAMLDTDKDGYKEFMNGGIYKTDKLNVRSVKLYADGALGSRGARLIEAYSDDTSNYGLIIKDPSFYKEVCNMAFEKGYQVNTHAIGDSGVRMMLRIYGDVLEDTNDLRWRIEHAQVVHPDDIHFFKTYSIIPSVQATHATSDMYWADERLGEKRLKWAYAYKSLLEQNDWLPNGTDFPIESINPVYTFYAAVFRKDLNGYPEEGFNPENAISREEALRSITIWAAKAAFEENEKGSIEKGKFADFVVLDNDLMEITEADIPKIKVKKTFLSGEKVFQGK
ncbi:MAG: amidohydrolase [Bacteroidales bacterium]|nr:amidohydrolase [Bacteroidales bacterium]